MSSYTNEDILSDPEYKTFIRSKTLKTGSKKSYMQRLRAYCNFNKMSLTELIEEAEKEEENGIKKRRRTVNKRIGDFIQYLDEEEKFGTNTIRGYFSSVKAFYRYCDIELDRIAIPAPNKNQVFDDLINYEEIKTVVRGANQRDRAIFTLHMSSGMGMAEIQSLTYGHFLKALKEYINTSRYIPVEELSDIMEQVENPIPCWKMIRIKTDYQFITFSSPEATREMLLFLIERQKTKFPITSKKNPLFNTTGQNKGIGDRAYLDLFERANDKHNLGRKPNHFRRFTSHELRRFFVTNCGMAGIDKMKVDLMVGHAINPTDAAYYKYDEEILKKEYRKALPRLTFDNVKNITVEDPEVKELRDELRKSKEFNEEMAKLLNNKSDFEKLPKPKGL